jgi:hypothetical protein
MGVTLTLTDRAARLICRQEKAATSLFVFGAYVEHLKQKHAQQEMLLEQKPFSDEEEPSPTESKTTSSTADDDK